MPETQASDAAPQFPGFHAHSRPCDRQEHEGRKFRENSQTIVINAHGGLLYLHAALELGAEVVLDNPVTEEEQECRVVYLGDTSEKGRASASSFSRPARTSGASNSRRKIGPRGQPPTHRTSVISTELDVPLRHTVVHPLADYSYHGTNPVFGKLCAAMA